MSYRLFPRPTVSVSFESLLINELGKHCYWLNALPMQESGLLR
jgi:hypothetical protein